jgi:hypothetical protein
MKIHITTSVSKNAEWEAADIVLIKAEFKHHIRYIVYKTPENLREIYNRELTEEESEKLVEDYFERMI